MNNITNIKINYMILEQILKVTGTYKNLCDEYEFLDVIFKQAKTGEIDSLFKNDDARDTAFGIIENITGVPAKYWLGEERIKLGIRCTNANLNCDGESIDTVDLENDRPFYDKEENYGHAYHGKFYQEQLKNPLHLEPDEIYKAVFGKEMPDENEEITETIESLYSLRGLLTVILLNMADEIELIDKANVYKRTKWVPYIKKIRKTTKHGITYSPKFVEIRKGLVQTIIRNIFDLGYVFTFRDLDKEFKI
ncbi:hypothetical protein SAMN05443428_13021 [Caloramator quimbayensis]|uniref:Uncharacterized protein n=1 Tax=Caloramator quimbayensis TaxID=1147123 RepID=A0A1T4YBI6_9CLOT|nr:hypothetical protein [Caloramator quimbayensis]SKA98625.1 hypothetical protein SAMN05443428_13021 [Caloramator quimbayensis]